MRELMFDPAKVEALETKLNEVLERAKKSGSRESIGYAQASLASFKVFRELVRLLDDTSSRTPDSVKNLRLLDPIHGHDPDVLTFKHDLRVGNYAVQTLVGKPREVYINVGHHVSHSHCNFSFTFLFEAEGGTVGIQLMTRYIECRMVAVAQNPQWSDPSASRNKVAGDMLRATMPDYGFRTHGLPVRLPDDLPNGYQDWTQWVALMVDRVLCENNLKGDGFLFTGTDDASTTKTLSVIGQFMLPNWWEPKKVEGSSDGRTNAIQ